MQPAKHRPRVGIVGVAQDGLLQAIHGGREECFAKAPSVLVGPQDACVTRHARRIVSEHALPDGLFYDAIWLAKFGRDSYRQIALHPKQIARSKRLVIAVAPEHLAALRINQPSAKVHLTILRLHDTAHDVGHPQVAAKVRRLGACNLLKAGCRRVDPKVLKKHEVRDQFLGHPRGYQPDVVSVSECLERQHDDRRRSGLR